MQENKFKSTAAAPPAFSRGKAVRMVEEFYGLEAELLPLPSERDQNFLVTAKNQSRFVLKIANPEEKRNIMDLQNKAMRHVQAQLPPESCPRLVPTFSQQEMAEVEDSQKRTCFIRLVTHIPGKLLADVQPHSGELMFELGAFFARLDRALADFNHPAADRELIWDIKHAVPVIEAFKNEIPREGRKALVHKLLKRIKKTTVPKFRRLPMGIIHNDGNDHNIIISPPSFKAGSLGEMSPKGIIDFGDMVFSYRAGELAVVCAYAMLGKADPVQIACRIVSGYHTHYPLREMELEVLFDFILLRLMLSVCISAYQTKLNPDNQYLSVSEESAWALLEKIQDRPPDFIHYSFRNACGLTPCPYTQPVVDWLAARKQDIGPLTSLPVPDRDRDVFDLSVGSPWLGPLGLFSPVEVLRRKINAWRETSKDTLGIGCYNEARLVYASELFQSEACDLVEARTVHLGLDFFMPAGNPVKAPVKGEVHSFQNNSLDLDYGPTIILKHEPEGEKDIVFYTLYGHLDAASLQGLYPGKKINKGETFAWIGKSSENGGWPPHLHFQLITDMLGSEGDYPGVARASESEVWLSLCPDPNLIAGVPDEDLEVEDFSIPEIIHMRKKHLLGALSVSYRKPLKIVRGRGCRLYDHTGRIFLDAVNNVPHVGHEHPKVVEAVNNQFAVLNTNTRYLHDQLVRYIERLCRLLPDPLTVCTIVNSGSEANDLALRMACSYTGGRNIIAVEGAYHGHLTSLIEISPYKFNGPGGKGSPPHTQTVMMPDLYRGPYRYGNKEAGVKYAAYVREAVKAIQDKGGRPAAFIAESLLSCGGQIVLPEGYLRDAYRITREAGGVCIADEVQIGFGRTGECFWGFETQNVIPDIVTLGKPIGNGFPLAAVITTREIADKFTGGMEYFNTYGGNPVACAAGLAVLDVLEEEHLQENALITGSRLKAGLERLKDEYPVIGDVRGMGLFIGVELVCEPDSRKPAPDLAAYAAERMREEGILISTDGPDRNVLKIKPPLVFNPENSSVFTRKLKCILSEDPLQI